MAAIKAPRSAVSDCAMVTRWLKKITSARSSSARARTKFDAACRTVGIRSNMLRLVSMTSIKSRGTEPAANRSMLICRPSSNIAKSSWRRSGTDLRCGSVTVTCSATRSVPARNRDCAAAPAAAATVTTPTAIANVASGDRRRHALRKVEANGILHPMRGALGVAVAERLALAVDVLDAGPRAIAEEPVEDIDGAVGELLVYAGGIKRLVDRIGDAVHSVGGPPLAPEVLVASHVGAARDRV